MPGITPATKSFPIESSVIIPQTMSKTLGGIGDGGCISTNNYENFVNLKKLAKEIKKAKILGLL